MRGGCACCLEYVDLAALVEVDGRFVCADCAAGIAEAERVLAETERKE